MKDNSGAGGSTQTSPGGSKVASTTNWFISEIQQMMFGFGDCRRPLHETAVLVEEIVHQQMASLLYQAVEVAVMRGSRFIGMEDLIFLMRKDKAKLRRILKYMEVKDLKAAALRGTGMDEEEGAEAGDKHQQPIKRRKKICYDFLASIDQTGELLSLFDDDTVDEIKHERLMRAELMARSMDPQQYLEFCEARQTNFSRRYKSQRFKDWLMSGVSLDLKPNPQALEIISYLAYETVAQVVDLALIVKQDKRAMTDNPLIKHLPNVCVNYQDIWLSASMASRSNLTSPSQSQSPPTTPTTPSHTSQAATTASSSLSSSQSSTGTTASSSTPSSAAKSSKAKKRKKSGPATTLEMSFNMAILPSDVREAIRRFGHCIGPFASETKVNHLHPPKKRLLCV